MPALWGRRPPGPLTAGAATIDLWRQRDHAPAMAIEVSARIGLLVVQAAAARGAAPAEVAAAAGFDAAVAADSDARIPIQVADALWKAAADATGDDAFGLHAAEAIRPGMFGVLDYAVRTAPTLRVAYQRLARYDRLLRDVAALRVVDHGETTRIEYADRPGGHPSRHAAECKLAGLVVVGAQVAGRALAPRAVELRHRAPPDTSEHARVFGIAPRFGAAADALVLDAAVLDAPCPAPDPTLWSVLEQHAEALLAERPDPARFAERVRHDVGRALPEGAATLAATARRLRMSERSVQRRLAAEGTTYEAIVDDLRRELAARYLRDRSLAIGEVAYLLGYSEPSAFHRAFKRWTGATPAEARRRAA